MTMLRPPPLHPVHPHGRGDNLRRQIPRLDARGSPPRAWGQRLDAAAHGKSARFTPTGVGTTVRRRVDPLRAPVHPHGRGDNGMPLVGPPAAIGSPPRAWGQLVLSGMLSIVLRFTPTGVGTTNRW